MNNQCIGVFDSGLGGLTAVKQMMEELPNENIIYFGDTSRVPYGTRSNETIVKYVRGDVRFLQSFGVKMIVVACGTASAVALPVIKDEFDIPFVGVVDATVSAAVRATKNKKIGVIGTPGTIGSGAYENLIHQFDTEIQTFSRACPLFVPLVENGHFDTPVSALVIEEYLQELREAEIDTLILGCTHYPLLKQAIARFMGQQVTLISPGIEVAKYVKDRFATEDWRAEPGKKGRYHYYVSDNTQTFTQLASIFLEQEIDGQVDKIDIEKY